MANAAVDYRSFIKVDEVDGRSPVERAAATSVPDQRRHYAWRITKIRRRVLRRAPGSSKINGLTEKWQKKAWFELLQCCNLRGLEYVKARSEI